MISSSTAWLVTCTYTWVNPINWVLIDTGIKHCYSLHRLINMGPEHVNKDLVMTEIEPSTVNGQAKELFKENKASKYTSLFRVLKQVQADKTFDPPWVHTK